MSENLDTIDAKSIEEYRLIKLRSGRKRKRIANQGVKEPHKEAIISPELVERVVRKVEEKFKVKIKLMKDRPILVASFSKNNLRPYGKLYEIERHAKALTEAWSRIKEKVQSLETN
jgi:hypothetical protein